MIFPNNMDVLQNRLLRSFDKIMQTHPEKFIALLEALSFRTGSLDTDEMMHGQAYQVRINLTCLTSHIHSRDRVVQDEVLRRVSQLFTNNP